jgi:hypothetical protein
MDILDFFQQERRKERRGISEQMGKRRDVSGALKHRADQLKSAAPAWV